MVICCCLASPHGGVAALGLLPAPVEQHSLVVPSCSWLDPTRQSGTHRAVTVCASWGTGAEHRETEETTKAGDEAPTRTAAGGLCNHCRTFADSALVTHSVVHSSLSDWVQRVPWRRRADPEPGGFPGATLLRGVSEASTAWERNLEGAQTQRPPRGLCGLCAVLGASLNPQLWSLCLGRAASEWVRSEDTATTKHVPARPGQRVN